MTDKQLSAEDDRGWPDRDYWCTCAECQCRFTGHKRQKVCRVCSELNASSHPQPECGGVDDLDAIAWRVSHPVHGWKSYDQKPDWADGDYSLHVQPLCRLSDAQRQIAEQQRLLAERDAKVEALTEYAAAVERSADKAEQERDQLRALLTAQPQAGAAQSAPSGEREAAVEAAYAAVVEGGWSSVKEMGVEMFQAGAAWQRTQAAGVPDGERLAELLESVRLGDDEAKPHGSGATYWNNAVFACQVAIRDALASAPAQPAAQSVPDRVSVPVELLQDLHDLASDAVEHHRAAFAGYKLKRQANMEHVVDKARALLAGHAEGGKV